MKRPGATRCGAALALALALAIRGAAPGSLAATVPPPQGKGVGPAHTAADPALIARGKHLTDLGDCEACHTANGGAKFAGGRYMGMPFGDISTPNITPDLDTGIGRFTDSDFVTLMRRGVLPSGEHIYPAMPYPWFATVKTDDLLAIKAYLFSLAPVRAPRRPNKIWFPFTIRPLIAVWDWFFVPGHEFTPDPKLTSEQNQGAYIINGLEHCGECHNNRNLLGNRAIALSVLGGPILKWYAPSLRFDKITGLGNYPDDDIFAFLKEGHSPSMGPVVGPMRETVDDSLSKLPDSDIRAMIAYLHTLPVQTLYQPRRVRRDDAGFVRGRNVYLSHCASCHQPDGKGITNRIPALDGNGMVRAFGPQDIVRVVLGGVEAREPYAPMPGLGSFMSDQDIADVSNYVRQSWSNAAPANADALLVGIVRKETNTLQNGKRPDGCPSLVEPTLESALGNPGTGIAATLHGTGAQNLLQSVNALVGELRANAASVKTDDAVNGMTVAYCNVLFGNGPLAPDARLQLMNHFSDRLYVQMTTGGSD